MPIKFQPFLYILQRLNELKKLLPQSKTPKESPVVTSDDSDLLSSGYADISVGPIKTAKALVFFSSAIFIGLLGINLYLDFSLNSQKQQQNVLIAKLGPFLETEKTYLMLAKKTELYKKYSAQKTNTNQKMAALTSNIAPSVVTHKIGISDKIFTLTLEGPNPLVFSKMFSQYSKEPSIATLVLRSASLVSRSGGYLVEVKGTFK